MSIVAVKLRIMPESLETDLDSIKKLIPSKLPEAKNTSIEEQEIAFGLKALVATFAWPESLSTDEIEKRIKSIQGVSSTEILDYRRAFG